MSDATNAAHEIGAFLRDQGSGEVMWPMPSTAKGSDPVSSLDERDTGHAFFSLLALRNSGGHAALLAAARPLARKIFLSGEPGRDINPRLIERLLSRPIDQVRFMENKKIFQDVQAGMTPYHVTVELVAMLIALAERDTIRTECEALRAAADAAGGYDKLVPPPAPAPEPTALVRDDAAAAPAAPAAGPTARGEDGEQYILFPDPAPLHELIEGPPRAPLPPYRELRVLVTGATSVTGAAIVKHLVALGVTVTAAASKTDSGATNGACLGSSLGAHRFVETDLFLSGGVAEEVREEDLSHPRRQLPRPTARCRPPSPCAHTRTHDAHMRTMHTCAHAHMHAHERARSPGPVTRCAPFPVAQPNPIRRFPRPLIRALHAVGVLPPSTPCGPCAAVQGRARGSAHRGAGLAVARVRHAPLGPGSRGDLQGAQG